jgi:hypothetical protein
MNFSFGIVTGGNPDRIKIIFDSIASQIPSESYEIIVVGGEPVPLPNMTHIPFDESVKAKWITRKKNIITNTAKFDNIVYMHDYIALKPDWYEGFKKFGDNFNNCMTKMVNPNGDRYRDWTLWAADALKLEVPRPQFLLPYDETGFSKYMYFSGAYWVSKKKVMKEFPLNERLVWGEGEDVEWSEKVRSKYDFSINSNSTVELLVHHGPIFTEITSEALSNLKGRVGIK